MSSLDLDPVAELRRVPGFGDVTEDAIAEMATVAIPRRARAHELIIEQGQVAPGLVILLRGAVKWVRVVSTQKHKKLARVLDVARAPEVLTDASAFDGLPADASVVAIRFCHALVLERRLLLKLMASHPSLDRAVCFRLVRELRSQVRRTDELASGSVEERVHLLLEDLAREQGTAVGQERFIPLPLRRRDLASMVNATTETVSRLLAKLEREGKARSSRDGIWWRGVGKRALATDPE